MTNIKNYLNSKLVLNSKANLYLNNFLKIGNGKIIILEPSHLKVEGEVKIFGNIFRGIIEILLNENKTCTVILNGTKNEKCPYDENNMELQIKHPETIIKISNRKNATKVAITKPVPISIGIKPI